MPFDYSVVICALLACTHVKLVVTTQSLQNIDGNCILSFVVPKEKMKSSCDLDEKISRRLSALEMKVNMYKQQVSELQIQLEKEKQLSSEKFHQFERLHRKMADNSADTNERFETERRLDILQAELDQLATNRNVTKGQADMSRFSVDGKPTSATVDERNTNSLPDIVTSAIHAEVNGLFVNFSKRFEKYIQEQIFLYSVLLRATSNSEKVSAHLGSPSSPTYQFHESMFRTENRPKHEVGDQRLIEEFAEVRARLNDTGDKIAKRVGSYMRNIASRGYDSVKAMPSVETTTVRREVLNQVQNLKLDLPDEISQDNEYYSGENSYVDITSRTDAFTPLRNDVTGSVSSRISLNSEAEMNSTERHRGHKNIWDGEPLPHQANKTAETEQRLKYEITAMLYSPFSEILTLIEKYRSSLEDKIKFQDERWQQGKTDFTRHVSELNNSIQTLSHHVQSLSQEFQDSFAKLEKIKPMEILVNEIKKNMTTDTFTMSAIENEEQTKKFKKLERLMGVYQQSLEHYRNETKHEYREVRHSLDKDISTMRTFSKTLHSNISDKLSSELVRLNSSCMETFQQISDQVSSQERTMLNIHAEIVNVERTLQSKRKLSDNEFEEMKKVMNEINERQRDFKKKFDNLEQTQTVINKSLETYAKNLTDLTAEMKLNLDQWLQVTFDYDSSRTDCFGDQYVRRVPYTQAKLVGAILCSPTRYKLYLSPSLHSKFLNIGDSSGFGEDHCEFVGAKKNATITLSPYKASHGAVQGYARNVWGQEPVLSYLNAIKPSPYWYECGIRIP